MFPSPDDEGSSPIITVLTIEGPSMNLHCVSMYTHKKNSFFFFSSVSNNDVALEDSLRVCLLLKDASKMF